MNRRALGLLAILIIVLMALVATAGLDSLPRQLRSGVQAVTTQLQSDASRLEDNRRAVERALAAEPDLFRTQTSVWKEEFRRTGERLAEAEAQLASLRKLSDANRRQDRDSVQQALAKLQSTRHGIVERTDEIRREAERWLAYKRDLPSQLAAMRNDFETIQGWEPVTAVSAAQKAMVDWSAKRDDLQQRINALTQLKEEGESTWQSLSEMRAKAESKDWAGIDYAALFSGGEKLQNIAKQLKDGAATANALAQQLYVDRSKMLLDLDQDEGLRQKVRVVETKFPDSTLQNGQTSQQERWEPVDQNRFRELADNTGMVIERKAAGKFDSEAERTAQPPGYAYVAPPGQSNQYGSWSNGVWQWLPQYLILNQLLRSSYGYGYPITSGDYLAYEQARRRGQTWYGHRDEYRRPPGGSTGMRGSSARRWWDTYGRSSGGGNGWYRERPRSEGPRVSGPSGYSGSRYQNRGSYSGSRYQSRGGGFGSFGSRSYSRGGGGRRR